VPAPWVSDSSMCESSLPTGVKQMTVQERIQRRRDADARVRTKENRPDRMRPARRIENLPLGGLENPGSRGQENTRARGKENTCGKENTRGKENRRMVVNEPVKNAGHDRTTCARAFVVPCHVFFTGTTAVTGCLELLQSRLS